MKALWMSAVAGLAMQGLTVMAANQTELFVLKTVEIQADADKVWSAVSKFGDLGAWHPAVAKTELMGGREGQVGVKRVLTLQDGGKINETLTAFEPKQKRMEYVINEGVLPVKNYASTLRVFPNGQGKSVVVWESRFAAKADGQEQAAEDTIKAVYDAGLNQLKKVSEQ